MSTAVSAKRRPPRGHSSHQPSAAHHKRGFRCASVEADSSGFSAESSVESSGDARLCRAANPFWPAHPPRHRREAPHRQRPFGRKLWRKAFVLRRTMPCEESRSGASSHRERLFCGEHQSKCGRGAALLHCRGAAPKVRRRAPLPIAGQNSSR